MKEYSPRRRTALVLCGTGSSGAYHAGVVRALDESGIRLDLIVGSGAGAVAAAYAAVAAGPKLHGPGGFWTGVRWDSFFRLRSGLRLAVLLLAVSFGVFLLPLLLAVVAGLLFPFLLVADLAVPAWTDRAIEALWTLAAALRTPYLAALAVPLFALSAVGLLALVFFYVRDRRRLAERFESPLDAGPLRRRLRSGLWAVVRGSAVSAEAPSDAELGQRYVSLLAENLGQPGFRELILRAADLETGSSLAFALVRDPHRTSLGTGRGPGHPVVDLAVPGYEPMLFDAVLSGLAVPPAPVCRLIFPRGGLFSGETHRLTDAVMTGGCGLAEAVAAGAEQVILASAVPESASPSPRRRGPWAAADAVVAALERQAVEGDLESALRLDRVVETVGHRMDDGSRAWQDPATGRLYRELPLFAIRPERRAIGPLELDGVRDLATEVLETTDDLLEQGYRDAYRLFIEPVVGASPEPRPAGYEAEHRQTIEL